MTDREHYDMLTAASDEEHGLAGVALRDRDYARYKYHTDRSWVLADEAAQFKRRLSESEQLEIRGNAWAAMASAFVCGLGRSQPATATRED